MHETFRALGAEHEADLVELAQRANRGTRRKPGPTARASGRTVGHGTMRRAGPTLAALAIAFGLVATKAALAGVPTDSTPRPFALVFEGAQPPSLGQENPWRRGGFSAVSPACSSGLAEDARFVYPYGVLREHKCADKSGSFTALVEPLLAEHGGVGQWKIVGGTGSYARLRGRGRFTGEVVGGSASGEGPTRFRTTWRGLVGFDDVAPRVRRLRASASALPGTSLRRLRVSFIATDDVPGNVVWYRVLPTSGSYALPFADGRARPGTVSVALDVRPRRPDLPLIVEIRTFDPVGNERRLVRSVPLD